MVCLIVELYDWWTDFDLDPLLEKVPVATNDISSLKLDFSSLKLFATKFATNHDSLYKVVAKASLR